MLKDLNIIFTILGKRDIFNLLVLSILLLITSFADFLSIGLIIVFFNSILENNFGNKIYEFLGEINSYTLNIDFIIFLVYLIFLFFLIKNSLQIAYTYSVTYFINTLKLKFSKIIFNHYLKKDIGFFFKKDVSEYIRNVNEETNVFTGFIQQKLEYINTSINIIIISSLVLIYDFKSSSIIILFLLFFYFLYFYLLRKKLLDLSYLRRSLNKTALKILNTVFLSFKDIRIFNLSDYFVNQFKYNDKVKRQVSIKKSIYGSIPKHFLEVFIVTCVFVILFYDLPKNYAQSDLIDRAAYLVTFLIVATRLYPSFASLSKMKNQLEFGRATVNFFKNNIYLFKKKNNKNTKRKVIQKVIRDSFEIKKLNFSINENLIFKNAKMKAFKKDFVYIGGKNGTGKTTLFDILSGLYQMNKKNTYDVFIDSKKIPNNTVSLISYITQDPIVFNDTIKNNIILNSSIKNKDLSEILKIACVQNIIKRLPKGINTILGENGIKLSRGNLQKIAIARGLVHLKASVYKILILDEATSAVDYLSEKKIFSGLKNSELYDLVIYTSHNVSNQKYANKKFIIKDNQIVKIK